MSDLQEQQVVHTPLLTPATQQQLLRISKWAGIIASVGFGIGAMVVLSMLVSGAEIMKMLASSFPIQVEGIYGALVFTFFIFFFVVAALLYYLHRGATLLKQGVHQNNNAAIAEGFAALKNYFIVMMVVGILGLTGKIISLFL